jgi:hypothetical protein
MSHQALKYFSLVIDIASVNIGNYDKRCIILNGLENAKRLRESVVAGNGPKLDIHGKPAHFDNSKLKMVPIEICKRFINKSALFKLQMDINQSRLFRVDTKIEELMSLNELRQVTTIFIRISLQTQDPKQMLDIAQETVMVVLSSCKKYEGSLRQFHVDDKGAVILIFFGLPPMSHENDANFGIKAALEIKNGLTDVVSEFSIGVTTGFVSIGAVGNAQRTEYALVSSHSMIHEVARRFD